MGIAMSGTSNIIELPDFLPYPDVLPLSKLPEINGKLVYIIDQYEDCIAVNVLIQEENICIRFGNWDGDPIDIQQGSNLSKEAHQFIGQYLDQTVRLFRTIGLNQALLYIGMLNGEMQLVDVRLSLDKFSGPGMIRDLFSKVIPTQNVRKIVNADDEALEAMNAGKGSYSGDIIIKSSAFETVERQTPKGKSLYPLYASIIRKKPDAHKAKKKVPYMPKTN